MQYVSIFGNNLFNDPKVGAFREDTVTEFGILCWGKGYGKSV